MLPDNSWYGHKKILFDYIGVKENKIYASLQHGWISQVQDLAPKKKYLYPILVWSKFQKKKFNKKKNFNVYAIGSPFLYLCRLMQTKFKDTSNNDYVSKGTIVFPAHSSQGFEHTTDHELLIKLTEKNFKGPYTVCFYYYGLNSKDISLYKKKNWRIICCVKNKIDQYSLFKIYNELRLHENIISTELSSPIFYGMYLKKKTKVFFKPNKRFFFYSEAEKKMIKFYKKKYPELFNSFLNAEKGYKLAKKELGFDCLQNKINLKKIMGLNSFYKTCLSKIFSFLYDIKYGNGLRKGQDLNPKLLKKYISIARDKKIYKV